MAAVGIQEGAFRNRISPHSRYTGRQPNEGAVPATVRTFQVPLPFGRRPRAYRGYRQHLNNFLLSVFSPAFVLYSSPAITGELGGVSYKPEGLLVPNFSP